MAPIRIGGCSPAQLGEDLVSDWHGTTTRIHNAAADAIQSTRADLISGDPFRVSHAVTGIFLVVGAVGAAKAVTVPTKGGVVEVPALAAPPMKLGPFKSPQTWANQMSKRGWTMDQIHDAVANGSRVPANNLVNPSNAATRYIHPQTGRSVVVDDVTGEILHVGADGFKYK